ncbi:glycosyltransferase family A protein [Bifidobacterium sp. UBA6881]|uniref:glycosyltransferase family A protein n=1 Tax=Bifidobacterium sp. UBA6881 TaxID=1946109 RepID=UPI0025C2E95A|nr:glycosyltransferase family A protein [Bifidobacterium sp. UBA6881]
MNYTFTVFTPTFNRSASIHRVYESLQSQTFHDFEWLIVDDGSEDDTADLVGNWTKEADFPIEYMKQSHAGKHIAWNHALQKARGRFFIIADSDDGFVPNALERLLEVWKSIPGGAMGTEALHADALQTKVSWLAPRRFLYHGWTLVRRMRNMCISCNMKCGV